MCSSLIMELQEGCYNSIRKFLEIKNLTIEMFLLPP